MKIAQIRLNNWANISTIELAPDSKLNLFAGKNHSGKTAILKGIEAAMKGRVDPSMIKIGADRAELMVRLDDGHTIKRTHTRKSTSLQITTPAGDIKARPQAFLESLVGNFSFNPIDFVLLDNPKKRAYLMEMLNPRLTKEDLSFVDPEILERANLDQDGFSVLQAIEPVYYDRRAGMNRVINMKKGLLESMKPSLPRPESVDQDAPTRLEGELQQIEEAMNQALTANRIREANLGLLEHHERVISDTLAVIAGVDQELVDQIPEMEAEERAISAQMADLNMKWAEVTNRLTKARIEAEVKVEADKVIEEHKSEIANIPLPEVRDVEEIQAGWNQKYAELNEAKKVLSAAKEWEKVDALQGEIDELSAESANLSGLLKSLRDDVPAKMLARSTTQIPGLELDGGSIRVNGVNLENMSTSEQVGIALHIVRELNRDAKIKVLCLDRAESLDDDTLQQFQEQIREDEFQYFLTWVQHGSDVPDGALLVQGGEVVSGKKDT